jgi:hypothetical protein
MGCVNRVVACAAAVTYERLSSQDMLHSVYRVDVPLKTFVPHTFPAQQDFCCCCWLLLAVAANMLLLWLCVAGCAARCLQG